MNAGWIEAQAATSISPRHVQRALSHLARNWPADGPTFEECVESFPLGAEALLHLLAVSSICAARLEREPSILNWLADPKICGLARGRGQMMSDLQEFQQTEPLNAQFSALRRWKSREMVRIALREVAGAAPLEETTAELSLLAEICLREVFGFWDAELRRRWGAPAAEFAILGLGKLGGRELNHSSDVDVIFLYSEEGQLTPNFSYHEWFTRLANKIIETFSASHPAGALFRIDLKLRPEGTAGPLVRSLESMENYYAGFGETWERMALIKARGIGGSRELAYEFLRQHQTFIYPKSPTPDLLDEIAAIKHRIERDLVGHENLRRNVKLGAGGIREIEFIVQALQLIHGSRQPFLQETSTLKALHALPQFDLLPHADAVQLDRAYHFLRRVEHRLQIEAEQQTHTIPDEPEALTRLARSLGFSGSDAFTEELEKQMRATEAIFQRVVEENKADDEEAAPTLQFFADEARAAKTLAQLSASRAGFHVAPRTRQVLRKLEPLLLACLRDTADPDAALVHFVRFVDAYGLRSLLFEMLVVSPRFLELLVKVFDASRFASELIIRRPQLVEELTRRGSLDDAITRSQHLTQLRTFAGGSLEAARIYRQAQGVRILLRDLLGLSTLPVLLGEQTALAEACLVFVLEQLGFARELTLIALGKFGGAELSYGADLDVLFVGENVRAAQELIVAMNQPSSEGTLFALDARLRPDGEKGPVVCPLRTYENYYVQRAQLWEIQALTRARAISGPEAEAFIAVARNAWRAAGQRDDLFVEIGRMRERVRLERSSGEDTLEFKTGSGGIVEVEFLVQALQMRAGIWEPNLQQSLLQLREASVLSVNEERSLGENYATLRRAESVLRRFENRSVSRLPADAEEQRRLALRVGYESPEQLLRTLRHAREGNHEIYLRYFPPAPAA